MAGRGFRASEGQQAEHLGKPRPKAGGRVGTENQISQQRVPVGLQYLLGLAPLAGGSFLTLPSYLPATPPATVHGGRGSQRERRQKK